MTEVRRPRPRPADVVTSDARRRAYLAAGLWRDETLAAVAARLTRPPAGERPAVIDCCGRTRSHLRRARSRRRPRGGMASRAGVRPGDVVSVQLPNWYETVAIDLGVLRLGAVLNPMLPIYRSARAAPHAQRRCGERDLHPRATTAASTTYDGRRS